MKPILVSGPAGSGTTLVYQVLQRNIFSSFEDFHPPIISGINYHLSYPHQIPFQWHHPRDFVGYQHVFVLRSAVHTIYSSYRRHYCNYPDGKKTPLDAINDYIRAMHIVQEGIFECHSVIVDYSEFVEGHVDKICDFLGLKGLAPLELEIENRNDDRWKADVDFVEAIEEHTDFLKSSVVLHNVSTSPAESDLK